MGHDLITIYWLKAVEYLLALSYLPLFVLFWKLVNPRRPTAVAAPVHAPARAWADQLRDYFEMPERLLFHPGHTWARVEADDTVTVGVDAFARQLVGTSARFALPPVGETVWQGEPAFGLARDGKQVDLLSPVDGTVVAVNHLAEQAPDAAHAAPYADGWLLKVRNPKLAGNLKTLLSGDLARCWMNAACERLAVETSAPQLGPVCLDGGTPVDGIAINVSPEHWDAMARRFFLTEKKEDRHA